MQKFFMLSSECQFSVHSRNPFDTFANELKKLFLSTTLDTTNVGEVDTLRRNQRLMCLRANDIAQNVLRDINVWRFKREKFWRAMKGDEVNFIQKISMDYRTWDVFYCLSTCQQDEKSIEKSTTCHASSTITISSQ